MLFRTKLLASLAAGPEDRRDADHEEIERPEQKGLEGVAVFVDSDSFVIGAGPFRPVALVIFRRFSRGKDEHA